MRLDELTLDPNFIPEYANAILSLERSRLIEYLRTIGLNYLSLPYKDPHEVALNAARTQGWQACLDAIEDFKRTLGTEKTIQGAPLRADFGSLERSVETGDLTTAEKEALKNGTLPDYSEFFKSKPVTTSGKQSG